MKVTLYKYVSVGARTKLSSFEWTKTETGYDPPEEARRSPYYHESMWHEQVERLQEYAGHPNEAPALDRATAFQRALHNHATLLSAARAKLERAQSEIWFHEAEVKRIEALHKGRNRDDG